MLEHVHASRHILLKSTKLEVFIQLKRKEAKGIAKQLFLKYAERLLLKVRYQLFALKRIMFLLLKPMPH